ncbi:MAG: hypothetical protein HQ579_05620, partial [Candidatus Omnitrophica bacterium]|nr:hypothetical protein [Candidatus Omnitrophota bacterium]
ILLYGGAGKFDWETDKDALFYWAFTAIEKGEGGTALVETALQAMHEAKDIVIQLSPKEGAYTVGELRTLTITPESALGYVTSRIIYKGYTKEDELRRLRKELDVHQALYDVFMESPEVVDMTSPRYRTYLTGLVEAEERDMIDDALLFAQEMQKAIQQGYVSKILGEGNPLTLDDIKEGETIISDRLALLEILANLSLMDGTNIQEITGMDIESFDLERLIDSLQALSRSDVDWGFAGFPQGEDLDPTNPQYRETMLLFALMAHQTDINEEGQATGEFIKIESVKYLVSLLSNPDVKTAFEQLANRSGAFSNFADIQDENFMTYVGEVQSLYRLYFYYPGNIEEAVRSVQRAVQIKALLEQNYNLAENSLSILDEETITHPELGEQPIHKTLIFERMDDDNAKWVSVNDGKEREIDAVRHLEAVNKFKGVFETAFLTPVRGSGISLTDRMDAGTPDMLTERGSVPYKFLEEMAFCWYHAEDLQMDTRFKNEEFLNTVFQDMGALWLEGDFGWFLGDGEELDINNYEHLNIVRAFAIYSAIHREAKYEAKYGNGLDAVKGILINMTVILKDERGILNKPEMLKRMPSDTDFTSLNDSALFFLVELSVFTQEWNDIEGTPTLEEFMELLAGATPETLVELEKMWGEMMSLTAQGELLIPLGEINRFLEWLALDKAALEEEYTGEEIQAAKNAILSSYEQKIQGLGIEEAGEFKPDAPDGIILTALAATYLDMQKKGYGEEALEWIGKIIDGIGEVHKGLGDFILPYYEGETDITGDIHYWSSVVDAAIGRSEFSTEEKPVSEADVEKLLKNESFRSVFNNGNELDISDQLLWHFVYDFASKYIGTSAHPDVDSVLKDISIVDQMLAHEGTLNTHLALYKEGLAIPAGRKLDYRLLYGDTEENAKNVHGILFYLALMVGRSDIPHYNVDTGSTGMWTPDPVLTVEALIKNIGYQNILARNQNVTDSIKALQKEIADSDVFGSDTKGGKILRQIIWDMA